MTRVYSVVMQLSWGSHPLIANVAFALLLAASVATVRASDLYSSTSQATAYIDWNDGMTIFMWGGQPVAYLYSTGATGSWQVFSFSGSFLGWFEQEILWDRNGDAVLATAAALMGPVRPAPVRGIKGLKPLKGIRSLVPLKPLFSYRFASTTPEAFFGVSTSASSRAPTPVTPPASSGRSGYRGVGASQLIESISRNGEFITLVDGSQWEIHPLDQITSSLWLSYTRVTVERAERASMGFDYLLSGSFGRGVRAKFLGY